MTKTNCVLKKISQAIFLLMFGCSLFAQGSDSLNHKVYKLNYRFDIPLTVVATGTALWGFATVNNKPPLDSLSIIALDPNDVNRFDRSATRLDAEFAPISRNLSDATLFFSNLLPLFLMLDEKVRKDWGDVMLLFLETQAIVGNLYSWGCVVHVDRIRPLVYNPDVPWEERAGTRTKNAFFSGHTSLSASASFFTAKVYCDYHPEIGNKKYLAYSLAIIPPALTGFFRYKGLKHFPTDVITGLIIGAGTGILVPHLHKRIRSNLTLVPFAGRLNGLAMSYKF